MKRNTCTRLILSAALVCLLKLPDHASAAPGVILNAIGPKPADVRPTGPMEGYLKVYSSTDEYNDGDLMYYPHSRYSILLTNGTRYKWVENHQTQSDESPERVSLPVGTYYVVAHSELDGFVKVAVVIKGGQTTVVNLERGRTSDRDIQGVQGSRAVKLHSGQIVGWRASS